MSKYPHGLRNAGSPPQGARRSLLSILGVCATALLGTACSSNSSLDGMGGAGPGLWAQGDCQCEGEVCHCGKFGGDVVGVGGSSVVSSTASTSGAGGASTTTASATT